MGFEGDPPFNFIYNIWTPSFDSTMLPDLQVSVCCALTTFEPGISQWIHPSAWLNANVKHIRAIFDGIVDLTGNNVGNSDVNDNEIQYYVRLEVYC